MIVNPAGTGTPSCVISASPIPLPPRSSRPPGAGLVEGVDVACGHRAVNIPTKWRDGTSWRSAARASATALDDYVPRLARGRRVCVVPTANAEDSGTDRSSTRRSAAEGGARRSSRSSRGRPRTSASSLLAQDVIYVGGGNTANMLAIWRVHGMDEVLREAWEHGVVLCGSSAGMICWFEAGVTDSFGPQLEGMRDGLGLPPRQRVPALRRRGAPPPALPRARRRAASRRAGPPRTASRCTSSGTELAEVVTAGRGKRAYRVEPGSETPLEARLL